MNLLYETHGILPVIVPQDAAGAVTGAYFDMQHRKVFCFVLSATPESELEVEVLSSETQDGAVTAVELSETVTVPTGGTVSIAGFVTPFRGRYLTLRVTGTATVSAVLVADNTHFPEHVGLNLKVPNEAEA